MEKWSLKLFKKQGNFITSMKPNTKTWLSKTTYVPEKRQIVVEFENLKEKYTERYAFFPSIFLKAEKEKQEVLMEVLKLYESKRYKVETEEDFLEIKTGTFEDLKKIAFLLKESLGIKARVIEPERQFLIQKQWSYFDCFGGEEFPKIKTEYFAEDLEKTVNELGEKGEKLLEEIALANLLKVPIQGVPEKKFQQTEIFIENLLYENKCFEEKKEEKKKELIHNEIVFGYFENVSEIDFSPVLKNLVIEKNIGFETMNCSCCKEIEENILPDSFAEVEAEVDGLYFESKNQKFAEEFHNSMSGKKERVERKKEWFMKTIPLGPFMRKEKIKIPLIDALELEKKGKAKILEIKEKKWTCFNRKGFLRESLRKMDFRLEKLEGKIREMESKALQKNLAFSILLQKSIEYNYLKAMEKVLKEMQKNMLYNLCSEKSSFYQKRIADSLNALQEEAIKEFSEYTKKERQKVIMLEKRKAFVKADSALALVKGFALKKKYSVPEISRNFKEIAFS